MRRTVRIGVFETNSSNTHSMTICLAEDYNKWKEGKFLLRFSDGSFLPVEEGRAKNMEELEPAEKARYADGASLNEILEWDVEEFYATFEEVEEYFEGSRYLEDFGQTVVLNGQEIVAFGWHGREG